MQLYLTTAEMFAGFSFLKPNAKLSKGASKQYRKTLEAPANFPSSWCSSGFCAGPRAKASAGKEKHVRGALIHRFSQDFHF
jgi:hypothetical protein